MNLRLQREQAVLHSPIDGVVVQGNPRVGDLVPAGDTVFEIARQQGSPLRGRTRKRRHRPVAHRHADHDQVRRLRLSTLRDDGWNGELSFAGLNARRPGATEAEAATFVAKIDLAGDRVARGDYCGQIKLGMAGQAEIVTEKRSLLTILLRRLRSSISLS